MNPNSDTKVLFGQEATDKLMEGVNLVCDATATTLGPRGRNVAINYGYKHRVLHDGVSVSESVNPKDPYQKLGAKIIKEAARKQRDQVGDGTTAVLVIAQAILKETQKAVGSGVNPMAIRKGLEEASQKVIDKITSLSTPIKTLEQKQQIATVSAENKELGELIADTIHKIGDEGIITVEESKLPDTLVEMQEGMQLEKGYAHPFMITDQERLTAVLEDAYVLVTDMALLTIADMGKFLDKEIFPNTRKVLFIAPEISGEFLTVLIGAKMRGEFLGIGVRAPGAGQNQIELLQDIAALTGSKFFSKDSDYNFEKATFKDLGRVGRVICSKISTILTEGGGNKKDVLGRIQIIKEQMKDATISEFDKEKLRERLGKLTDGIAVVKVGGETEVEMTERKERAIDAVAATQAACKYGVVAGGETIYLAALDVLSNNDELGYRILKEALKQPFRRLVENAGYDSGEKLAELKMNDKHIYPVAVTDKHATIEASNNLGFDVTDGVFKNMIRAGIIDPTSVSTTAIKTAVSVAIQIMTAGAAVVPEVEEKK